MMTEMNSPQGPDEGNHPKLGEKHLSQFQNDLGQAHLPALSQPQTFAKNEPGLSAIENNLINSPLPRQLDPVTMEATWAQYQKTIAGLLLRMGAENTLSASLARLPWVRDLESVSTRLALLPKFGQSALHNYEEHGFRELRDRLAGECNLMELSAAAGYRTFCLPALVKGLVKTGKMRDKALTRMFDTFEFLNTMVQYPLSDPRTERQLDRTNGLHSIYKVAGAGSQAERDLFKYIALNMFYVGPSIRPDITPQERHALCGLTVLVAEKMGQPFGGTVKELEQFIVAYEDMNMFKRDDKSPLRKKAVEIAHASQVALGKIPIMSAAKVHGYVPFRVKQILELD